jgi:hypothetical protein
MEIFISGMILVQAPAKSKAVCCFCPIGSGSSCQKHKQKRLNVKFPGQWLFAVLSWFITSSKSRLGGPAQKMSIF